MIDTPVVRREPVPGPHRPAARATQAKPAASIEDRIHIAVDEALAEALAKVSTPADVQLAAQQQAFDKMLQQRTEQSREVNAIREMGLEQAKHDDEFMKEWIRLI